MKNKVLTRCLVIAGAAAAAAGCSTGSGPLTRTGPPVTPSSATASAPATVPTVPAASPSASGVTTQRLTVTPATKLAATQQVLVQASGFSPAQALVVTQCAAKGAATGPADCDLTGMQNVTADANGQVKVQFTVHKGPFGTNKIVCGPAQDCLISVTQATFSPTEEADAPISFR